MPYYAVHSGDIFSCELADDEVAACVNAVNRHSRMVEGSFNIGQIFVVAEFNKHQDKNVYVLAEHVLEEAGFTETD